MESWQSPLTATFLTGAETSQRLHWPRLHFWSLMFGFVALARVEPESARVTCKVCGEWNQPWATCNQVFFVKNKISGEITLRSMQLYLVPPSYGRSGAHGWYSTGWKIKLLLACYFCYQLIPHRCTNFAKHPQPLCRHLQWRPFHF